MARKGFSPLRTLLNCPPQADELAEAYCLHRLPESDSVQFEIHFLTCPDCSEVIESTKEFLASIRLALAGGGSGTEAEPRA